jgi:quercetin dioxygenase-like cupin family protein
MLFFSGLVVVPFSIAFDPRGAFPQQSPAACSAWPPCSLRSARGFKACPERSRIVPQTTSCGREMAQNIELQGDKTSLRGTKIMEIKRAGTQPSARGPSDWFTGTVRIDPLFQAPDPAFVQGASVTFEPGARTAWHTHPLGQTLIVTAGCGWAQRWGGTIEEIRPGDVVWFAPGEKHWHGAAPNTAMTHIAIQERLNGKVVDWMEHVSDEQYRK